MSLENDHTSEKKLSDETESIPPNDESIPDGGLIAWLQVVGTFFLFFNASGVVNSFGVFQTYYEQNLMHDINTSKIAWIGSLQACLTLFVGALTGPLFDMGYFRFLIGGGTVLAVFSLMMTSLCKEYWQWILAQSLGFGLGGACLFVPGMAITSTYFSTHRALAIGIAASGSSIGAVVYAVLFRNLIDHVGYGWTVRIFGFIALGTLSVSNVVMRPRIAPAHRRKLFVWHAFKEPPFALFALGIFLGFVGAYIPYFHATAYAQKKTDASESLSFYLVAIINGASAVGRIVPNMVAHRFGPFNTIILMALISTVLAFGWMGVHNVPGIVVFAILYGFSTGGYVSLPTPCVTSITPNLHEVGARVGMCFLFAGLGMLIGSPIAGALVDIEAGSFWKAQLCCAMLLIGSSLCFIAARLMVQRSLLAAR
ncbi:hypothetical protein MYAM1_001542 [Malassezia yamatoensis]|uniref:Major facilitator superfamily (MFS) profile domain-containing protein n=1 Tax=Malassezia yamatoensis TaxID=253288 RepID=A0AAJ5YT74_9BASI|nr:hypothetical protein MYAM1_001542 [Malassezia yamatoensis]